jgi:hypothetical protein
MIPTAVSRAPEGLALPNPGRSCPNSYRYGPSALAGPASLRVQTLWIAGGLYGNPSALESLIASYEREPGARQRRNRAFRSCRRRRVRVRLPRLGGRGHGRPLEPDHRAAACCGAIQAGGPVAAGIPFRCTSALTSATRGLPSFTAMPIRSRAGGSRRRRWPRRPDTLPRCGRSRAPTWRYSRRATHAFRSFRLLPRTACSSTTFVEAVPIRYDAGAWERHFTAQWPADSDAHASYYRRIVSGPEYTLERAVRLAR